MNSAALKFDPIETYIETAAAVDPRFGEALRRISILPEGREMVCFLEQHGYTFEMREDPGCIGGHELATRKIIFNSSAPADYITAFLPHEIFHAIQFENAPELKNFKMYFESTEKDIEGAKGDVFMPQPADFLWALNMMEIAAYAVGTDFVKRLGEAGDTGASSAYEDKYGEMSDAYDQIMGMETLNQLKISGREILNLGGVTKIEPEAKRAFAAATAAYYWFWNKEKESGAAPCDFYNDPHMILTEGVCQHRLAPIFRMAGSGQIRPCFGEYTRDDLEKLGEGYSFNPLTVHGFNDIAGPEYRRGFTEANKKRIHIIECCLGFHEKPTAPAAS